MTITKLLTNGTAQKIADALGCPLTTYRIEIVLDWRTKGAGFIVTTHAHPTDEQGKLIVEAIEADAPVTTADFNNVSGCLSVCDREGGGWL
jgi:restriction endonuclease Mrr